MERILKLLLVTTLLSSVSFTLNAQDIDGISLWDTYTKAQLMAKYGQPIKYYSQMDDFNIELTEEIVFKDVAIRLEGNHVVEFGLRSTKPRAMTKFISGGIKIGDPESVTKKLEKYFFKRTVLKDGTVEYYYLFLDDRFVILTKNGIITHMYATATTT